MVNGEYFSQASVGSQMSYRYNNKMNELLQSFSFLKLPYLGHLIAMDYLVTKEVNSVTIPNEPIEPQKTNMTDF